MQIRNRQQNLFYLKPLVCLFILGIFVQSFLLASRSYQESQEKPIEPVQKEAVPEVILAPDIVVQAQKVSADLHLIQGLLHPSPAVEKVEADFDSLMDSIKQANQEFEALDLEHLSFRKLNQIQDQWQSYRFQVETLQSTIVDRSQQLEAKRIDLSAIKDTWGRTQVVALQDEYSEALQERIKAVLFEINNVEQELRERLEAVFSLQDQVSTQFSTISKVLNRLDTAGENSRRRLFAHDSLPLWKAIFESGDGIPLSQRIKDTWQQKVETLGEFLKNNLIRLFVHFGLFLFLGFLFSSLRRHTQEWIDIDDSIKASMHILSHPFSVALIVAMIVRLWIYPQSPQIVDDISRLILVVPLLRVLPGLIPSEFRRPIYGLGGLYVIQLLGEVMPDGSLIERVVILLLTLLALVGMMWIIKPGGVLQRLPSNRWFWFLKNYFRFSFLLFAISIVSNIIGNVSLADLLASGTFLSIYGLVLLVMAVMVSDGLIYLFLKSRAAQSLRMVRLHNDMWNKGSRRLIRFAAIFIWINHTLDAFSLLYSVRNSVTQILQKDLSMGTLTISLEDVFAFVITLVVSIYLAKMIRFVLSEDVLPRLSLPRGVPAAISFVAYYFILLTGFVIALGAAGIEWSRFAILAGALGVGIGFGLQDLVRNFVSGLILIFERPIKVGDMIEFGGQLGEVLRIGLRSSTVRTWEGAEIIVPNGNLISSEVINWTLSDRKKRLKIYIGVAYGTDPDLVIEILTKAAGEHPDVLENPAPLATFKGFGESSLDFELFFSIKEFLDRIKIPSELNLAIHAALKAAGIEIPFPQRDLHLRSVDPKVPDHLKKD